MLNGDFRRHVPPHLRAAMERLRDPQAVWDIFRDDTTIAQMEECTARKRPAVEATSSKLLVLGEWVRGKDARKTFGKIARHVMEARGYTVDTGGVATPEDALFTKGTRYRLPAPAPGETLTLVIRDIDRQTAARLRTCAQRNRHSIETEALLLLTAALSATQSKATVNLARAIHRRFAVLGGIDELPSHPPVSTEPPPDVGQ